MFAAEYEPASDERRRRPPRTAEGEAAEDGMDRALCKVLSVSVLGVRIQTYTALTRGSTIWLTLPAIGRVAADVRWADDFTAGCQFRTPLSAKQFKALSAIDI